MTAEKALWQGWIGLPGGRYVSSDRMRYNDESFRLSDAANLNIGEFNKKAKQYDVQPIGESDSPIDRLVRVSVLLSRMGKDNSFVPDNMQYVGMALDAAVAKATYERLLKEGKIQEAERFKSLADFYKTLKAGPLDTVAEILQFHEKIAGGRDSGKYMATPHVFDKNGILVEADEAIKIAPEGRMRMLGRRGYPTDTSEGRCFIENIEHAGLPDKDLQGYWLVGSDPVGQQRIVLRGPLWDDEGPLSADVYGGRSYSDGRVGALRLRENIV
jgi:hypothetical protein